MAPGFLQADFERAGRGGCEEGGAVEEGFGALGYEGEGVRGGGEGGWEAGVCWLREWCGHFCVWSLIFSFVFGSQNGLLSQGSWNFWSWFGSSRALSTYLSTPLQALSTPRMPSHMCTRSWRYCMKCFKRWPCEIQLFEDFIEARGIGRLVLEKCS